MRKVQKFRKFLPIFIVLCLLSALPSCGIFSTGPYPTVPGMGEEYFQFGLPREDPDGDEFSYVQVSVLENSQLNCRVVYAQPDVEPIIEAQYVQKEPETKLYVIREVSPSPTSIEIQCFIDGEWIFVDTNPLSKTPTFKEETIYAKFKTQEPGEGPIAVGTYLYPLENQSEIEFDAAFLDLVKYDWQEGDYGPSSYTQGKGFFITSSLDLPPHPEEHFFRLVNLDPENNELLVYYVVIEE